tara:strand:- start:185 stop:481 length:297 start_codon:yes stop_codon:yes gene_type:complete
MDDMESRESMDVWERHLDKTEQIVSDLEDTLEDLKEENTRLRRELSLSSPIKVGTLIASVREYLEWLDSPNVSMSDGTVNLVKTHLRGVVDNALRELP